MINKLVQAVEAREAFIKHRDDINKEIREAEKEISKILAELRRSYDYA